MDAVDHEQLESACGLVDEAQRIVVLTGAGISTDSGIPDFRGPNGVWTKNPAAEKASNISYYLAEPEVRRAAWQSRLEASAWSAEPNRGHLAVVDLERSGRLHALITQNIDGLHQRAGIDPDLVIEVHGTIWYSRCWECGDRRLMEEMLQRVRNGEPDPTCELCGGIVKSDTISFGQSLIPEVIDRAMEVSEQADVLVAIGSTLSVYPVANCVPLAKSMGAKVVIVNAEPTEMDDIADVVVRGSIGEILPQLFAPGSNTRPNQ